MTYIILRTFKLSMIHDNSVVLVVVAPRDPFYKYNSLNFDCKSSTEVNHSLVSFIEKKTFKLLGTTFLKSKYFESSSKSVKKSCTQV